MFSRCRQMRSPAIGNSAQASGALPRKYNPSAGAATAAARDASDAMRNATAIARKITSSTAPSSHDSAKQTPAAVATPLPPAKRWKIGNKCPRNTASAAPAVASDASPQLVPSLVASQTASQPLIPSPASVSTAADLLPVRSTFVAPGLPDP